LITVVAGEFDEVKEAWRGMPVTYYAPKAEATAEGELQQTPQMLEFFSKRLGVDYGWEKIFAGDGGRLCRRRNGEFKCDNEHKHFLTH